MRAAPAALLALLAGCAPSPARPSPLRPAPRADDAVELAALLPERADRCVVVRPTRVAARRRALVLYRSWAGPEAWSREASIVAYAEATTREPRARRTYLRFAARTPALLEHLASLPLRWIDDECEGDACRRPVARWLDERTLEVSLHRWPRARGEVPTAACVQLASNSPGAIEVAADGGAELGWLGGATEPQGGAGRAMGLAPRWAVGPRPHRLHRRIFADGGTLTVRRELTFVDEPTALTWETWRRTRPRVAPSLLPSDPAETTVTRVHNRVELLERYRFEELELSLEDDRLERRAYVHRRSRSEPLPVAEVDVANLAVVRHQVQLRQAELSRARGDRRRPVGEALAALLERAAEAHPARLELVEQRVRLELEVLERPARAVEVVERVLASGLAVEPARWRLLRREALAQLDPARLAEALVADGITAARLATGLSEDLAALRDAGVSYEWAEGAWVAGRGAIAAPARLGRPGAVDAVGALGAIALRARAGAHPEPGPVHVVARWPGSVSARALGRSRPELLVMRERPGRAMAVGAVPRGDLANLRALGAALASVLPPGPFELVVELARPDGGPAPRFALSGRREGEQLRVERVGDGLASVRWDAVERYLAAPIANLPTALFPPPELTIRAASAEEAVELRRAADAELPGACHIAGPYLRCRAPGRPERLDDVLVAVARGRL